MRILVLVVVMGSWFAVSSARADKPVAPKAGAAMCVLTAADFKAAGVDKAGKPNPNVSDGGASAYCVYAGKSSATGGIELDVFFPAGANPTEVKATEETAVGEMSASLQPIKLAGADSARWTPSAVSGGPEFAVLVARRDKLVFVIGLPKHKDSRAQLTALGARVLGRVAR